MLGGFFVASLRGDACLSAMLAAVLQQCVRMTAPAAVVIPRVLCSQAASAAIVGAHVASEGRLAAVTVAGDGVAVYDTTSHSLVASYALGGAGRLDFVTAAVVSSSRSTCSAVVTDTPRGSTDDSSHRLVTWPATLRSSRKAQATKAGLVTAIADVPQSTPLPAKASSLHVLYPPSSAASPSEAPAVAAVVLQDARVGYCALEGATQVAICETSSAGTNSRVRASSSTRDTLFVAQQAAAGSEVHIHQYAARYSSAQGVGLQHVRSIPVECPSARGAVVQSLHACPSFLLVSWSTGGLTLVNGLASGSTPTSLQVQLPDSLQPSSQPAQTGGSTVPAGSKRKAAATESVTTAADSQTAMAIADSTQVFAARLQKGDASGPQLHYALLDHQFGCVVASGTVTLEVVSSQYTSAGQPPVFKLFSHAEAPGSLLAQVNSTVVSLTVEAKPANLLALVGRMSLGSHTAAAAKQVPASGTSSTTPGQVLQVPSLMQLLGSSASSKSNALALQDLPDQVTALASPALQQTARQLLQALQQAGANEQAPSSQVLQQACQLVLNTLQSNARDNHAGMWAVHTQLLPALITGLTKAEQWNQLEQVLQAVPQQSLAGCSGMLTAAAHAAQYRLLPLLCVKMDEITPSEVVEVLQVLLRPAGEAAVREARNKYFTALRQSAESAIADAEQQVAECTPSQCTASPQDGDAVVSARRDALAAAHCAAAAVDGFSLSQVLLHAPLSVHLDPASLAGALLVLSNKQVDRLLSYLTKWLDKYTHQLGGAASATAAVPLPAQLMFPTYAQVLEWVRLLLDAHLPRLLMASQQPNSLPRLLELTQAQVTACKQLMPLVGAVEHVRSGAPLPAAHVAAASQYLVQYIDLGIRAQ